MRRKKYRNYWIKQLKNISSVELFTDYPRSTARLFEGEVYSCKLNSSLSYKIKNYAKKQNFNLSSLFLGVFNILISQYYWKK
ncbi:condensation domain-containing protein [Candidatus Profftella armatura]